jgi:hypothetical protein
MILLKVALSTIDQIKNQIRAIPFLLSLTCANVFNISPVSYFDFPDRCHNTKKFTTVTDLVYMTIKFIIIKVHNI